MGTGILLAVRRYPDAVLPEDDTLDRLWRAGGGSGRVEPLDDYLVIEPSDEAHETPAGLIIPASDETPVRSGVVVAAGDDVQGVGPGDKVIFLKAAGIEMRVGGEPIQLVRRRDLIARFGE
jgi:co-chaperonin GroES (HSP10)